MPIAKIDSGNPPGLSDALALHRYCGIYTQPKLARRTLTACGWAASRDLSSARLLEPCAGDGVFVVEAAQRLVRAMKKRGQRINYATLHRRILAYELVGREAVKARSRVARILRAEGLTSQTAKRVATAWIKTGDFLLSNRRSRHFSHVVGNPPFVRWSRIPAKLRTAYERHLPPMIAKGDLQLPFLHSSFESLAGDGRLAFVCSDRWRHMAYGSEFKTALLAKARMRLRPIVERPPFAKRVNAYADLLILENVLPAILEVKTNSTRLRSSRRTFNELGCSVRVGPALGCEVAFSGRRDELDVEESLLAPFVRPKQIHDGRIEWQDLYVVVMHDANGSLIDLDKFPRLQARLRRYADSLCARAVVRNGGVWYRPIDRVQREKWASPKLLIPEIAKVPRVAFDQTGLIPSHGVYAIVGPEPALEAIYEKLAGGALERSLEALVPRIKGGYTRCYKRFLDMITV